MFQSKLWLNIKQFTFLLKNGPPEAVRIILSIFLLFSFLIKLHIEKCSESIGIKSQLCFFNLFSIISQAQMIVSLLAIKIFLENGIIFSVGSSPSIPEIYLI